MAAISEIAEREVPVDHTPALRVTSASPRPTSPRRASCWATTRSGAARGLRRTYQHFRSDPTVIPRIHERRRWVAAARAMKVGVVGLGYVGLPLAVCFAEAGHEVIGVDIDPRKIAALARGRVVDRGHPVGAPGAAVRGLAAGIQSLRGPVAVRGGRDRRPDAADGQSRAGPRPAAVDGPRRSRSVLRPASSSCWSRRRTRARRASARAVARGVGPAAGRDFNVAFSPERVDPGRTDFTLRTTPKVVGGLTERLQRAHRGPVPRGLRHVVRGLHARGRGAHQAAGEHLPLGEHRAGQRAGDAVRSDGHRHLGGRGRGRDEALRVHALRARPRHGRTLPAGRPVLPVLARARVRDADGVYRARRRGQREDARALRGARSNARSTTHGQPVKGSKIALLGVSYKAGVGDMRESPAMKMITPPAGARRRA